MQCDNCTQRGLSCPYTFTYLPDGKIPDPCPYKKADRVDGNIIRTTGYSQIVYPEWSMEELKKDLKAFIESFLSFNDDAVKDILIGAEAQKIINWVNDKYSSTIQTITITSS